MGEKKLDGNTLYKKVGTRYKPVQFEWETYGWEPGFYLVHVDKGCTGTRKIIDTDNIKIECALRKVERAMIEAIVAASIVSVGTEDGRTRNPVHLTDREKELLAELAGSFGSPINSFLPNSIQGIVDSAIKALREFVKIVE
jgi:Ribonuclease G/E